ncbi:hypothetical protein BOX15_Mlig016846g2 [Macrostomum lignano]|uniref:Death domain-containing protein n=1 Tax=Macrostomum lignano TaxID=282301 RepID=A0A267EXN1_9PLAT|nr:hypothetical protein BOX15_Mlig016846g2 [Macrostomum lignano]
MAESSMPKRSEDDCDMVTSLQEPFLSKAELALHEAARSGNRTRVEKLIKVTGKIDCRNSLDRTALHMAASKGHREIVRILIESGKASVEVTDKFGMSPLMWATYFGHTEVVNLLLDRSANIRRRNKLGMHVVHIAAEQNHCELVKIFINKTKKTLLNDTEKNGMTAVMIAAAKGNGEVVQSLISLGADLKIRDNRKRTVLHVAAESGNERVLDNLIADGPKMRELINERDDRGRMPIHYAVEKGFAGAVEILLAFGASPNDTTDSEEVETVANSATPIAVHPEMSPFLLAAREKKPNEDEQPAEAFADGAAPGEGGKPRPQHGEILRRLVQAGTDIDAVNSNGYTALHYAALNDDSNAVYTLVHFGCDISAKNNRMQTPLHMAAEQNRLRAAEALLLSGAPLNIADKTGKTPLVLATQGGCICIVDMIIKAERHREKVQRVLKNEPNQWDSAAQADQLDAAAAFTPDGYENRSNINESENIDDELTESFILENGTAPAYRLREFNQPYADEFKLFLWKLAFDHLRYGEWKKLALFWRFRLDHITAIEQQYSDEKSYKQHGYRVLCIWFHGIGWDTPIRGLYEALVQIDRRSLAERVRKKLDRSAEYYSAGRKIHHEGRSCTIQ